KQYQNISWHDSIDNLPKLPLFLVANEFFDALPIKQYVGEEERKIIFEGGKFSFSPEGEVTKEVSELSLEIIAKIANHIRKYGGAALIIDYGYESTEYKDTLQALKNHKFISVFDELGEADITAHVDFIALQKMTQLMGAKASKILTQGEFFKSLGAELRAENLCKNANEEQKAAILSGLDRLIAPEKMGKLFKVMVIT
ncbi:MAG: SAM-dependent methyltransferase, partial [Pseudomonadota bacterium]